MGWLVQIFVFGALALGLFLGSLGFEERGRYALGAALGAAELLPAAVSSVVWADALRVSGKADWFVLGILSYPLIGLIFWCMIGAGIFATVKSIFGEARAKNGPAPAK